MCIWDVLCGMCMCDVYGVWYVCLWCVCMCVYLSEHLVKIPHKNTDEGYAPSKGSLPLTEPSRTKTSLPQKPLTALQASSVHLPPLSKINFRLHPISRISTIFQTSSFTPTLPNGQSPASAAHSLSSLQMLLTILSSSLVLPARAGKCLSCHPTFKPGW